MPVRFDEYKGFVIDPAITNKKHRELTTGINKLAVYDHLQGETVVEIPEALIKSEEPSKSGKTKKSKQQKKEERQLKKIRISQRRLQQRLNEDFGEERSRGTGDIEENPIKITNDIKRIYGTLSTKQETKLLQYESVSLYSTDLTQILPGEWLNDNIISLIYEFLNINYMNANEIYQKSVKLLLPSIVQLIMFTDFDILDAKDFRSSKFIFIPINETQEGDHWVLGVLNLLEHKFFIYDSMISENAEIFENLIVRFKKMGIINNSINIDILQVRIEQQSNFDDCGVYLIMISCFLINMLVNDSINFDLTGLKFNSHTARLDIFKLIHWLIAQSKSNDLNNKLES